jgi:hypothetical protein
MCNYNIRNAINIFLVYIYYFYTGQEESNKAVLNIKETHKALLAHHNKTRDGNLLLWISVKITNRAFYGSHYRVTRVRLSGSRPGWSFQCNCQIVSEMCSRALPTKQVYPIQVNFILL